MGMGYRDEEEMDGNKPSGGAQQGDRYGVGKTKTLAHEPYKKETIGQGVGRDNSLIDERNERNEGRGPSVTFDNIAGRPKGQSPEAERADMMSMPPQY